MIVKNLVAREKDGKYAPHENNCKNFFTSIALKYGSAVAIFLSKRFGGPGKTTIYSEKEPDCAVWTWLSEEFISLSTIAAKNLFERINPGTSIENIN